MSLYPKPVAIIRTWICPIKPMNAAEYFCTPSTGTFYQNYDIYDLKKKKIVMKDILEQFQPCMEFKCLQPSWSSSYLQQADFCCIDYQILRAKATSHRVNQQQLPSQTPVPAYAGIEELLPLSLHSSVMLVHTQPHSQHISNQLYSHQHLPPTFPQSFTEDRWTNPPPYTNNPHTYRMTEAF